MFKLASLFVDITAKDDQFQGKLGSIKGQLGTFGTATAVAFGNLSTAAILGATGAVGGFFAAGVKGAVDLAETTSKVQAIFGSASSSIQAEAQKMADAFGVSKGEYLDAASGFGAAFKAAGSSASDAAAIGNQLAKLGMDMASFGNGSNAEVFTALQAALRGEFDPLERFNVMLTAAKVSEEAMSLGLVKNAKDLDEASKKQATLSLIMKGTVDQQGDLARTADGSANLWRKFTGTMENLSVAIGTTLEPAINSLLLVANDLTASVVSGVESMSGVFTAFADVVKSASETVGVIWRNLGDIWEIFTIRVGAAVLDVPARIEAAGRNIGILAAWIGRNWYELITDALNATATAWTNWGDNIYRLGKAVMEFIYNPADGFTMPDWTPLLDGFKAVTEALPEMIKPALTDVQGDIDAIEDRMVDRETKRLEALDAKRKAAAATPKAAAAASAAVKKDDFKSELVNTGEFSARLRASIFGGDDDTAKKQLATQKEIAVATKETAEAVKKPRVAVLG